jgi:hypothetical protein
MTLFLVIKARGHKSPDLIENDRTGHKNCCHKGNVHSGEKGFRQRGVLGMSTFWQYDQKRIEEGLK